MAPRLEITLLAAAAAVVCLALFVHIDTGANWFFWGPLFDAAHYPLFFVCTLLGLRFARYLPASLPRALRLPYLPLAVAVVAVELIQPLFERSASLVDVQNGLLGIAAAGVAMHSVRYCKTRLQLFLVLASVAALSIPLLWPLRGSLQAIRWRQNAFPVLARFADTPEAELWGGLEPETPQLTRFSTLQFVSAPWLEDGRGLLVATQPGYYSGAGYSAGDFDWSSFSVLTLSIHNPQDTAFDLHLRIDDAHRESRQFEGRFNRRLTLVPGTNFFRIPVSEIQNGPRDRTLDLSAIRSLLLFADINERPRIFVLDHLELQ